MNNQISTLNETFIKQNNRLDALLALRGLACLIVVISHCNPQRNSIIYKNYDLSWITFSYGGLAVWIFFVLSGYLMGKAFYTQRYTSDIPGVIKFWRNRALRIFPLYYFAVLILTLFVYPDWLKIENWGYLFRVCTFTYQHSLQIEPRLNFNAVFWSLSTEVQFYLVVPFIYNFFKSRLVKSNQAFISGVFILIIIFIIRLIFWILFRNEISENISYVIKYSYTPLITNLDFFICGFLVNILFKYKPLRQRYFYHNLTIKNLHKKYLAVILLILLYLFTAHHFYHQELLNLPERNGKGVMTATSFFMMQPVTAIITSFFILTFESDIYDLHNNEKLSFGSILKNPIRILEVFGTLSYGVYIWHFSIIEKITPIFTSSIPIEAFYKRVIATIILSTVLATVTYYLVELPFARWKTFPHIEK